MKPLVDARKLRQVLVEEKKLTEQIVVLLKQDQEIVYASTVEVRYSLSLSSFSLFSFIFYF